VIIGYAFGQYSFDTNLLNLQATDGEASRWQKLLMSTEDIATFAIALYNDRDSLLKAENKLRSSTSLVRRTESLFPDKLEEKRTLLSPLCSSVQNISIKPNGNSDPFNTRRQLWNLRQKIRRIKSSGKQAELALSGLAASLDRSYTGLRNLEDVTARKKLVHIDRKIRNLLEEHLPELQNFLCPPEFLPELLPDSMRSRFVGSNGSLALYVYPRQNVWNREELNIFVEQAREIEPRLFGEVISFYENGGALIRSFLQAALYSLITILVMLILWSKSIRLTLIAVSPLIASAGLLLGLMRWNPWPIQWNYANFFALPILIGICVDSGIHLVRAWRDQNAAVFKGAMKAVLLSSLTTIIGFGILATSTHQGVRSLGFILLIGITLSLLYSLILLPTVLHLFYGGKKFE
jgi:predicted RND superfamily exporter protein